MSVITFKNDALFSRLSIFARDCTIVMGIMKKNVRKKEATAIISLLMDNET